MSASATPAGAPDDVEEGLALRPKFYANGLVTCVTTDARTVTTIPQQQLFALNSPFVVAAAKAFSARVEKAEADEGPRLRLAWRLAYGRPPTDKEADLARDFLRAATVGMGAMATAGCATTIPAMPVPGIAPTRLDTGTGAGHVVVVGAGAWGGWTAYHLRRRGARVTLIDQYGPANSKATSGDETRGIRSSYGDRAGDQAAQWGAWAKRAMKKWRDWDATWGREMKIQLFFQTGDLIMRPTNDAFIRNNRAMWDKIGGNYMVLTKDEVMYRYPQYNVEDMEYFLFEPEAGFARARRSCEAVAGVFKQFGGELVITRAWPTTQMNGKMTALQTSNGEMMSAGTYLFACGPWLRKVFPVLMGNRLRTPMGSVYYFGAPTGEYRMQYPNIPTFNYPGATGWPLGLIVNVPTNPFVLIGWR